ncbi:hypothetical protein GLOIN_2v1571918 [Rhizophagus clarus]|uniref:Uncharacterized protein n=1 Tax=Rhizophagus clarus TaxID=94130 RepID=A0A8H3KYG6_9GLOM|nr:hypothetical protein GLOIN_2v1571918 [Rhizophagus clarus]
MDLTKAFYTAKKYREGTGNKRSVVGEKLYKEFSTKFWQNQNHHSNKYIMRMLGNGSKSSSEKSSDIGQLFENSFPVSRSVTPSVETSTSSRPITPTIPSFSQSDKCYY